MSNTLCFISKKLYPAPLSIKHQKMVQKEPFAWTEGFFVPFFSLRKRDWFKNFIKIKNKFAYYKLT